ncbi:possible tyrosine transporter P-protein [Neorhodopirellula lusitana]|uniref:Possible tyrosine transporter P-protein n=1 Tax=Neorhodopirellula lusitana TaxID=445327 RepID=A0ABY1PNE6_9BACT|nr:ArsB/NhaD family transporter [Neorhodopirellula lusitana]SMP38520.1 possible tyrosine transporter P-protein [Neorhodopirellula lusitana]
MISISHFHLTGNPLAASLTEMPVTSAPAWVMLLFAAVMMTTYVGVAVERFHKTVAALCGAAVLIVLGVSLGLFEYSKIYDFLKEDLNIFGVIIGTGILVDVVGKSGLFHFISMWIVRLTGGQANRLFLTLCVVTFLFVSVLTIVPAMLILSSLVLVICRSLGYKPMPLLLSVAVCANSGAIATFASGLPNIMIGTAAGIPYVDFLQVSLPYAVVSLVVAIIGLRIFFRNDLPWKQSAEDKAALKQQIEGFDPWAMVEDRAVLYRSALILLGTVCGFALAQPLHVGMDFIAMVGATAALLFSGKGVEDAIGKVNWTVILFFMGLFVIIGCVKQTGALKWVAEQVIAFSDNRIELLVPLMGVFSAVASSIVDNIPVAATLIPIVQDISGGDTGVPAEPLWWTLVICCNLGGNGTPIGSISCVIAIYALKKEAGVHVGWGTFLRLGGGIMFVQVAGAIAYVMWMHNQGWIPDI